MTNLRALLLENNMSPIYYWPVGVDWRLYRDVIISDLRDFDAIIVNGEGTVHNDNTRKRAASLLELGRFCRHELQVPCFLINATLYNISDNGMALLSQFDKIFVRDSNSQNYLSANNLSTSRTFDLSLLGFSKSNSKYRKRRKISIHSKTLVTGSVLRDVNAQLRNLSARLNCKFEDIKPQTKISAKISKSLRRTLWRHKRIANTTLSYNNSHLQWLETISSHALVVCGRFHAATLCTGTLTPFIALESNTPKISCFLNDVFGNTDRLLNTAEDANALVGRESLSFNHNEIENILSYLHLGEEACTKMMKDISQAITS